MQRSEAIEIQAPIDKVWSVAANQFDEIGVWASMVSHSKALPLDGASPASELGYAGRVCATKQGETVEKIVAFDANSHTFTYEITGDAMPGFVKRATNTWQVTPIDGARSQLTMTVNMETGGFVGALMSPMMAMGMGKVLRTNLEEIKHFIETGQQHARKKKAA
ncbi:MAG: SRPBCC family protein, partial [Myxococcota bacterium]